MFLYNLQDICDKQRDVGGILKEEMVFLLFLLVGSVQLQVSLILFLKFCSFFLSVLWFLLTTILHLQILSTLMFIIYVYRTQQQHWLQQVFQEGIDLPNLGTCLLFTFLLAYQRENTIGKGASFAMHLILMSKFHIKRQGTKRQRTRQCQSLSLLGQDMKTSRKHDNVFILYFPWLGYE